MSENNRIQESDAKHLSLVDKIYGVVNEFGPQAQNNILSQEETKSLLNIAFDHAVQNSTESEGLYSLIKARTLSNLSHHLIKLGKYEQAEVCLTKSIKMDNKYSRPDYHLARIYQKTNRPDLAQLHAQTALEKANKDDDTRTIEDATTLLTTLTPPDVDAKQHFTP